MPDETTDFGFESVPTEEKSERVREVFDSVAARYDLMNDLMSWGVHRLWKRFAASLSAVREGHRVLDLAAGSGDMTRLLAPRVAPTGLVVVADVNRTMLCRARRRLVDAGLVDGVRYAQVDAESLPFADGWFDRVCIAFGLRNVTRKQRALESAHRVLRPGGQVLVLEFSALTIPGLKRAYDAYSFSVLPWLGGRVAGDADAYRYLAESIRRHPDQQGLLELLEAAGFERCTYHNLSAGIAALHLGYKL